MSVIIRPDSLRKVQGHLQSWSRIGTQSGIAAAGDGGQVAARIQGQQAVAEAAGNVDIAVRSGNNVCRFPQPGIERGGGLGAGGGKSIANDGADQTG